MVLKEAVTHTPGPWTHNADDEPACCRISIEQDGALIAEVLNVDDFPCLDPDNASEIQRVDEEARATARLIAASPEMLAALKALVGAEQAFVADTGLDTVDGVTDAVLLALAAIAKAEGAK